MSEFDYWKLLDGLGIFMFGMQLLKLDLIGENKNVKIILFSKPIPGQAMKIPFGESRRFILLSFFNVLRALIYGLKCLSIMSLAACRSKLKFKKRL